MSPLAEQETIVRWDREDELASLYTADAFQAGRWRKLGYLVEVTGRTREGEDRSWSARVPVAAITFRRLVDGQLPTRAATPESVEALRRAQEARREAQPTSGTGDEVDEG